MKVAKWGNSLAIRLPASVAQVLDLKEGDDITFDTSVPGKVSFELKMTRDQIIERMRALRRPMPADFKFDRDEANAR